MQRRTFLLFGLFVVTAWFYSSVANSSSQVVAQPQQEQDLVINQHDPALQDQIDLAGDQE